MFDPALFVAFLAAATILTITPGVDTALMLRTSAADGARAAGWSGLGIVLGLVVWAGAVSLGLGALLKASELAYTVVKWLGAAYLLWLGANLLLRPRKSLEEGAVAAERVDYQAALRRGFLSNILNPKIGVFYVTFLPQFIPHDASVTGWSLFLAGVHIVLTMLWFALLIAATIPLGEALRRPRVVQALDRLTGGIFIAFGIRLAVSKA